ncbi:BURP domain-containing protein 3-like [Papaver somniferum]|uniref:BURP domain-containing protein 3-like n=1 Tax=Papaver somniferum TaxID=3469 RepID=UPI000E6F8FE1|nr:BURP domain-containing protein 3-like [Papaver somniferum]
MQPPLPSEIYWKNKLPNTPMPNMLRDFLHPADLEGKASIDRAESRNIYTLTQTKAIFEQEKSQEYSKKLPLQKLNLSQPLQQFALSKYSISTIRNDNAETNRQLINSPAASLFFLEKDLYPGAKMNLHFVVGTPSGTTFLPQKLAKMTPFSSNKLLEIFNQFAIKPKSEEAELVNEIIMDCEQPAIENEEKYCATSLESLVEYGTSKLGKDVNVLTTVIVGDKGQRTRRRKQEYDYSNCW